MEPTTEEQAFWEIVHREYPHLAVVHRKLRDQLEDASDLQVIFDRSKPGNYQVFLKPVVQTHLVRVYVKRGRS